MLLRRYHKSVQEPQSDLKEESESIDIDDITKAEIIEILADKGIEHNPKDRKDDLYNLMVEGD